MSKRIRYSNEPIKAEVVRDFLPSPEQLVAGEEGIKVTISLSRRSVDFFKEAAERNHASYQRMIRRLLDTYADQYRGNPTKTLNATCEDAGALAPALGITGSPCA